MHGHKRAYVMQQACTRDASRTHVCAHARGRGDVRARQVCGDVPNPVPSFEMKGV